MVYLIILSMLSTGAVCAQTLELRQIGVSASGEVEIAVVAELADARASGVSFYVAIPEGAFEVVGAERPFAQGPLMAPAVEFANETMPREEAIGAPDGMVLLPYAAVRGPRCRAGSHGAGRSRPFCPAAAQGRSAGGAVDQHADLRDQTGPGRWGGRTRV